MVGLVVVIVSCLFQAVFAVRKAAELAVAHLLRVSELKCAGLAVVEWFSFLVRFTNKKYGVAIFVVELDVVYKKSSRLLKKIFNVIVLFPKLGFTLCLLLFLVILLERHFEVAVISQHRC